MALPKLMVPTYELTIPSSGNTVKYRPFLVKEEKILLMATEGDDEKTMTRGLKQIVSNCLIDQLDIDRLKIYDLEYIFLQLRSKSIGEESELRYVCQNKVKEKKIEKQCSAIIPITLSLANVSIKFSDKHEPNIKLTESVGMVLKDPEISLLEKYALSELVTNVEGLFEVISKCVDYVYEGEKIYKEYKKDEMENFLGALTQQQFLGVKTYFETLPRLEHSFPLKCTKCGNESTMTLTGLSDFFM